MGVETAAMRRWLRPFRPILGPPWRAWQRERSRIRKGDPAAIPYAIERLRYRVLDRVRRRPPIRPLRRHEIAELAAEVPYYKPRRGYLEVAAAVARDLIARHELRSALELGPHLRPLIVNGDVLDLTIRARLRSEGRRIAHDATVAPWPIADRAYDLFVALQVFEHLGSGQADAFGEVRRVARHAILSLPIDWVMDDPTNCHHGLTMERAMEWFAPVAPSRILVGTPGPRKRIIFVFENLPPPDRDRP